MYNNFGDIMKIPSYLNDNDYIGITACSCGVLDKIDEYENSIKRLNNFNIIETDNVRTSGIVSSDKLVRAKEVNSLQYCSAPLIGSFGMPLQPIINRHTRNI